MRAKKVEAENFTRGGDPYKKLGIGKSSLIPCIFYSMDGSIDLSAGEKAYLPIEGIPKDHEIIEYLDDEDNFQKYIDENFDGDPWQFEDIGEAILTKLDWEKNECEEGDCEDWQFVFNDNSRYNKEDIIVITFGGG